ncbi:RND transporter [Novosphingobium sp. Rr 2-17]|uniref:RND transporter n=1 Tax=Novosphingobium sp. Rr 2-17 TaxID=555793 RepID=UPI001ED8CDA1|nr:RND transporter [Novosphingobium sp. Rr 2-17]
MSTIPSANRRLLATSLAALTCAALFAPLHAQTTPDAATSDTSQQISAGPPVSAWRQSLSDPYLSALIEKALTDDNDLTCAVERLRTQDEQDRRGRQQLGARIERLFGKDDTAETEAARNARIERIALRRVRLSQRVALAYLEVRRLQRRVGQRKDLVDQYRDNAEIAEFRRQAGLVPAIDGAVARTQDNTARAELDDDQVRLTDAIDALAGLVNEDAAALAAQVGSTAAFPPWTPAASATAPSSDALLSNEIDKARRTVRDARTAYREGAGSMASLYVAEAAALALEQALVDRQARALADDIRHQDAQDPAWARQGLEPVIATPPEKRSHASAKSPLVVTASRCD